jgi:hypothetical protein
MTAKDQPRGYHGQFVSRKSKAKNAREELLNACDAFNRRCETEQVQEAITEFLKDNAWVENDNQGKDIFFVTDWLINNGVKVLFGMFVIVATLYLVVRI